MKGLMGKEWIVKRKIEDRREKRGWEKKNRLLVGKEDKHRMDEAKKQIKRA